MVRIKIVILCLLGLLHVGATVYLVAPGYISIDEALHHWTTRAYSVTGGFALWNGYDEFATPELHHPYIRVHAGKLYSQYPPLFSVLALPFYRLFGFYGLFVLNSICFVLAVLITFFTAMRLFEDTELALNACLVLILATFAWEYSQAAWPHAAALLFVVGAFHLFVLAFWAPPNRGTVLPALAAGLVAGFGPGMRLDAVLVFPALVLPFVFARPWRPREACMVLLGAVPGMLVLAIVNSIKFGAFNPFYYGEGPGSQQIDYFGIMLPVVGVLVAVWVITRSRYSDLIGNHYRTLLMFAALVTLVACSCLPQLRGPVYKWITAAYAYVIDIRAYAPETEISAMTRSSGGGVVYIGALKKALLQSMPFLALLVVPLIETFRRSNYFAVFTVLFMVPLVVTGFNSYSIDHHGMGGLCLNCRYFVMCLPFFSILVAYALRYLKQQSEVRLGPVGIALTALATAGTYFLLTRILMTSIDALEFPLLIVPLVLAGLLLLVLVGCEFLTGRRRDALTRVTWVLVWAAMVWSGLVSFTYDYPEHRWARSVNYQCGKAICNTVAPNSILFAGTYWTAAIMAVEKDRVRIALPFTDQFRDFEALLTFQLKEGRKAFGSFTPDIWAQLQQGPLRSYKVTPLLQLPGALVKEISYTGNPGETRPRN